MLDSLQKYSLSLNPIYRAGAIGGRGEFRPRLIGEQEMIFRMVELHEVLL